jgi:hypothetical protein
MRHSINACGGSGLIARPLFQLARFVFDGSSAIVAAAIKSDAERLKNSPRLMNQHSIYGENALERF